MFIFRNRKKNLILDCTAFANSLDEAVGMLATVLGKNLPGKNPPDSKPNPIPNLTLTLPHGPSRGNFPDTASYKEERVFSRKLYFSFNPQQKVLEHI